MLLLRKDWSTYAFLSVIILYYMYYSVYKDKLYVTDTGARLLDEQTPLCKLCFLVWATGFHIAEQPWAPIKRQFKN